MAAAVESTRLPEIVTKSIYDGKFKDRNPQTRAVSTLVSNLTYKRQLWQNHSKQ